MSETENLDFYDVDKKNPYWFKLDNAATIYPAAKNRTWNASFRLGIVLKEEVDGKLLQQALDDVIKKIPTYQVQLRMGLFWYYFQRMDRTDVVEEESYYPCEKFNVIESDKPAIRVLYYKRRIAMEVFHSVADGGSVNIALKMIVARYLQLKGYEIAKSDLILDYEEPLKETQIEDSFQRFYTKDKPASRSEKKSYQYRPKDIKKNFMKTIHGIMPVADIKKVAKERGLTITDYLLAVFLYATYLDTKKPVYKPIKVSIPVSLRSRFGSDTMRNFSLYNNIGFEPDGRMGMSFDDIVNECKGQLEKGVEKSNLQAMLNKNVSDARNPFVRFLPIPIKMPAMKFGYGNMGELYYVTSLTNIGLVKFPEDMQKHIDRVECLLGGTPYSPISVAVISDTEYMNLAITSYSDKRDIERHFFRFLAEQGVRIRIESSTDDCEEEVNK